MQPWLGLYNESTVGAEVYSIIPAENDCATRILYLARITIDSKWKFPVLGELGTWKQ